MHPLFWKVALAAGLFFVGPSSALAQVTGIAGEVKDTTGAVLPGVTVEASSPSLIERVRTATTDGNGLYRIVDLRPGVYTVTFTLVGFATVQRERVELTGAFTATVNAELGLTSLQETVTVSAQSPVVDTRNVVQQQVLDAEIREALPAARSLHNFGQTIPGILGATQGAQRPAGQDVGGVTSDRGSLMIHGSRFGDFNAELDGLSVHSSSGAGGAQTHTFNPAESQEYIYELGAISAATLSGGVRVNVIPKEGGNRYSGFAFTTYTDSNLASNNLTADLQNRGLRTTNTAEKIWDYNFAAGGPVEKDKLWFFASYRNWGQHERVAGMFRMIDPLSFVFNPALGEAGNADLNRPVTYEQWHKFYSGRLTWQASARNKVSVYAAHEPREQGGQFVSSTRSYEAANIQPVSPQRLFQGSWKSPVTNRILLEAGVIHPHTFAPSVETIPGLEPNVISVSDNGTGMTFRASTAYNYFISTTPSAKAAISYVTGSHASRFGVDVIWGNVGVPGRPHRVNQGMTYTLLNGVPRSITVHLSPRTPIQRFRSVALYAQDQWTVRRLTVTAGLRLDAHEGWAPEQESGPGPFVPFQRWPEVRNIPRWNDLSPRLGVAYDLFGSGKTALKGSVSRYVVKEFTSFPTAETPMLFNVSAVRQWDDRNVDFVPQESELGGLSNSNFGTAVRTRRTDDDIRRGWNVRPANWEFSGSIQQEIVPRVSATFAYIRRNYVNFTVSDNLAVTPADYDEYCIAVPPDARLPGGGGNQLCGLYDLNPSKRGLVDILTTSSETYGTEKETFDGIDLVMNARLPHRITIAGGLSTGTSNLTAAAATNSTNKCYVVDSPEALRFCDLSVPWQTMLRISGTLGLPWASDLGVSFQSNPGPQILANYTVVSSQVSFVKPGRNALNTGSATFPLIQPFSEFGDRLNQLDVRLSKSIRHRAIRARVNLDIANALNSSAVLLINNTYGVNWLRPTYIHPGRIIKPSITIDF